MHYKKIVNHKDLKIKKKLIIIKNNIKKTKKFKITLTSMAFEKFNC